MESPVVGTLPGMTTPAKLKLKIYCGATFRKRLTWKSPAGTPIDLSGCTARMQIRAEVESPAVLLELTTANGRIALGGVAGTVDLLITDEDTAAIAWESGVFDLEIAHPDGSVTRLAKGTVITDPGVTRA